MKDTQIVANEIIAIHIHDWNQYSFQSCYN